MLVDAIQERPCGFSGPGLRPSLVAVPGAAEPAQVVVDEVGHDIAYRPARTSCGCRPTLQTQTPQKLKQCFSLGSYSSSHVSRRPELLDLDHPRSKPPLYRRHTTSRTRAVRVIYPV